MGPAAADGAFPANRRFGLEEHGVDVREILQL
jgi:hypothetical protein